MGCGSSSLKGDAPNDLTGNLGPPAKKVRTNFTDVDFSSGAASDRRGTLALAPDEQQRRGTKISQVSTEVSAPAMVPATALDGHTSPSESKDVADRARDIRTGEATLEPYRSLDGIEERVAPAGRPVEEESGISKQDLPGHDHHEIGNSGNGEAIALANLGTEASNPIKT